MITCIGFGLIILLLILKGMTELALYFAIALGIIILLPIDGFYKEFKVIELEPLRRDQCSDKKYYVEVHARISNYAKYAYNNNEAYDMCGLAYEEKEIFKRVKIYEDPKCDNPYLKICITKPKRFFMTLAPFWKKVEYIFYIPEGAKYDPYDTKKKKKIESNFSISID